MEENVTVTLTYVNDEGDDVEFTRTVSPFNLGVIIELMDARTEDDD